MADVVDRSILANSIMSKLPGTFLETIKLEKPVSYIVGKAAFIGDTQSWVRDRQPVFTGSPTTPRVLHNVSQVWVLSLFQSFLPST